MDISEVRRRVEEIRDDTDFEKQAGDEYDLYTAFIEALAEESIYDIREAAQMAREIIEVKDMPFRRHRLL